MAENRFAKYAQPSNRFAKYAGNGGIWQSMGRSIDGFNQAIDEGLERDKGGRAPFQPSENANEIERRKAYALNRYYDQARFEANDEAQRRQLAVEKYYANDEKLPQAPKMSRVEAFGKSATQAALDFPLLGDAGQALAKTVGGKYVSDDVRQDVRNMKREAVEQHPLTSAAGDVATFLGPGAQAFQGARGIMGYVGGKMTPNALIPAGNSLGAKAARYVPKAAAPGIAGMADYALYEGTVGESTRAAVEGAPATMSDRMGAIAKTPTDPLAYAGFAVSPIARIGRGTINAGKNTIAASKKAGKLQLKGGSLTPPDRAKWVESLKASNTPQGQAYRILEKRLRDDGITPDMLGDALKNYHYGGYSTVDEMLFELAEAASDGKGAGQVKQLAVALGSVGGDAQQTARNNFDTRKLESATRIRDDLRKATGLQGDDFYQVGDELDAARRELPKPLYEQAHAVSVSDKAWMDTIHPTLEATPAAHEALADAAQYARNRNDVEVAGQIDSYLHLLRRGGDEGFVSGNVEKVIPGKLSTKALDYIDRMLGDKAASLRRGANPREELASAVSATQTRLRQVLDAETGLNKGRDLSFKFRSAKDALEFGRKAVKNGTDLYTLQNEFSRQIGKFDDSTINSALLMGWMQGAEDFIGKASNPATAIRQLYGSPRQREKMVQMLQGLDADGINLTPGMQSDATKRLRQVVGNKYRAGERSSKGMGRFDREMRMLQSENQIVGNSQTAQRNEAIAAQGGIQRAVNAVADALLDPRQAAAKLGRQAMDRVTQPGIFKPEVNRELGNIMFTGGKDNLQTIVDELVKRSGEAKPVSKAAKSSGAEEIAILLANKEGGGVVPPTLGHVAEASIRRRNRGRNPESAKAHIAELNNRAVESLSEFPPPAPELTNSGGMGPLPAIAGIGAVGVGIGQASKSFRQSEAGSAEGPIDLNQIRAELADKYAEQLTFTSSRPDVLEHHVRRIRAMDSFIEREAQRVSRPKGSPQMEAARQKIVSGIVQKITFHPEADLTPNLRALDELDGLMAGEFSDPSVPRPPSLKPAELR